MFQKILCGISLIACIVYADFKTPIEVGTSNSYRPFAYIDEQDRAAGYDVDVLRLLSKYDKRLVFHFNPQAWNALFVGLDAGKYQMLAYQINKTKEREEKYIFSDTPYFYGASVLVVRGDSHIRHINELKGKKIGVGLGDSHAFNLEKYLKKHSDLNIKIVYYKNSPPQIADLANGRIDAIIDDPIAIVDTAKALNVNLKTTDFVLERTPVFFIFPKTQSKLKDALSQALQKAHKDGQLKALSIKYFGKDYTQDNDSKK